MSINYRVSSNLFKIEDNLCLVKTFKNYNNCIAIQLIAAAASEPEASELGSILFGAWRSKVQNALWLVTFLTNIPCAPNGI